MRRLRFLQDAFWPQAERLSYYVLLPALFMHALAMADLRGLPVVELALTLIAAIVAVAAVLVLAKPWLGYGDAALHLGLPGRHPLHNYVGLSAAGSMLGASALPLAAVANAAIVPTVNVLCVLVFARWGSAQPTLPRHPARPGPQSAADVLRARHRDPAQRPRPARPASRAASRRSVRPRCRSACSASARRSTGARSDAG